MKTHHLKTWPEYFKPIMDGSKKFEVRRNDRDFKVGDTLNLKEYTPGTKTYTGRAILMKITFVLNGGCFGVGVEFCVMSLEPDIFHKIK